MENDEDLSAIETTEFSVNQETALIESNNPKIYLRDRGFTPEPWVRYFTLYWDGREIGIRCSWHAKSHGFSKDNQRISEMHWIVETIGTPGGPINDQCGPYVFSSYQERSMATQLITRALSVYGAFNNPKLNYFPIFKKVPDYPSSYASLISA